MTQVYFERLIDAIWKILPLREENNEGLKDYLDSLKIQLIGALDTYEDLQNENIKCEYNKIINFVNYMIKNDVTVAQCKRETFKCISIIKKLENIKG